MDLTATGLAPLHTALRRLYDEDYALFHRLFAGGRAPLQPALDTVAGLLAERGLAERDGGELRAAVRFHRLGDDLLATDHPGYTGRDRVLYLSDNESLLLARNLPDCTGRRVLDVGAGSGVQAVAARRRGAAAVTSIDISPRAVAMTRFNLALNGLPADDVHLVGLADFTAAAPFDIVVNNPPFVPVPPGTPFMTSGAGGLDGLDFVRLLVDRLPDLLHERGELHLTTLSPGGRHVSEVELLLLGLAGDRPYRLRVREVFGRPCPIAESLAPFKGHADLDAWQAELAERGYTHMHNLLIALTPAAAPAFERSVLTPAVELHPGNKGSTTWDGLHAEIRLALESAR
ncbi:methyltransferase [Dactylosporangium vinaceum]|uniref:Methyltransferase n=1 Tax=Dactylosporangium vinaceum TaxID=53362 RepID=A0ABV5MSD0_9ACTN|nr:methyltransferase [Dactylosporangium vinaceum]UAC00207.1 methyltransferase [Dactylosporangium vinaceum]